MGDDELDQPQPGMAVVDKDVHRDAGEMVVFPGYGPHVTPGQSHQLGGLLRGAFRHDPFTPGNFFASLHSPPPAQAMA